LFRKKKNISVSANEPIQNDIGLTTAHILKKVKELEIKSKMLTSQMFTVLTSQMFTGEYHSAFKGRGMSFREVREYHAGDDVRFIDWNVSARYAHPFSKVFEEERELVMMLLIDTSTSNLFGSIGKRKKDLITEIAAILAFSAINNNDKVGVIFFSNRIEKYIPPKKGRDHALYIVRELLTVEPTVSGTNLDLAIKYFNNTTRQKSISFILSDFITGQYVNDLKVIGKRHDVVGMRVYDKMDMQLLRQNGYAIAQYWLSANAGCRNRRKQMGRYLQRNGTI